MLSPAARHGGRVAGTNLFLASRSANKIAPRTTSCNSIISSVHTVVSLRKTTVSFLSTSSNHPHLVDIPKDEATTASSDDGTSSSRRLATVIQDLEMKPERISKHQQQQLHDGPFDNSNGNGGEPQEPEPPVRHPRYHATPQMSRFGSLYHPLKAFHIASKIDLVQVMQLLNDTKTIGDASSSSLTATKQKFFGKNSLVIQLPSPPTMMPHHGNNTNTTPHVILPEVTRYMAVFRFGSVVFLNVSPRQVANLVQEIKTKCSMEPVASGDEKRENFGVMVSPAAMLAQQRSGFARQQRQYQQQQLQLRPQQRGRPAASAAQGLSNGKTVVYEQPRSLPSTVEQEEPDVVVTGDYCIVPDLDLNGVAVISNILAQTVAMDSYNEKVDEMLNQFEAINSTVIHTGSLPNTEKTFLFKTVAKNNAIFIDMIRKIKLKDRSETAWTITKHESIHYALKEEFEIDDRFDQIDFKLNLIQQNAKFFLEVLQSQKSNSLEWCIVILILLECCIMTIDMSGMGPGLYEYLSSWISWPTVTTTAPPPPATPPSSLLPPTTPTP